VLDTTTTTGVGSLPPETIPAQTSAPASLPLTTTTTNGSVQGGGANNGGSGNGSGSHGSDIVRTGTDAQDDALIGLGMVLVGASILVARRSFRIV
jgi:hypothetical protein